ncbi:DUF3038 domain-containing protein [Waterburya agarophytonicola K14]|uniref:DUF3038 domain-containing protein n=1 Tax=Waterburya agarophytonicola KI4 TaxID=2874699 RepID=A0A964BTV4_9CYAN|nr:DUF3038 domain-containing protein [Waterburya agarophytonicola]MCC0178612.1 DUF3038 domain-containing protein [Waterburya agarophytonicola KI4]
MTTNTNADSSKWQDLSPLQLTNDKQLENIKSHLDLILLALEAIGNISSETILVAAKDLGLESVLRDRITLWRLRSSNPQRKSSGGRKKLDIEEARSLVLIICHLANKHQELLRRAVSLLEQVTEQKIPPHQTSLLGNYLDNFINYYQERIAIASNVSSESLSELAFNLLISLLFYSGKNGHRLLWMAIFDSAQKPNL